MILNLTKKTPLSFRTCHALHFAIRARGMIGRDFSDFDAMVFPRCSCVHTLFMRIPLDLIFVGRDNRVLKTVSGARPWRLCFGCPKADTVVELPEGAIRLSRTERGDVLDLRSEPTPEILKELKQLYRKEPAPMVPMGEK